MVEHCGLGWVSSPEAIESARARRSESSNRSITVVGNADAAEYASHEKRANSSVPAFGPPDRLYLWKDAGNSAELIAANYDFDAKPFFSALF